MLSSSVEVAEAEALSAELNLQALAKFSSLRKGRDALCASGRSL